MSSTSLTAQFLYTGAFIASGYEYELPEGSVPTLSAEPSDAQKDIIKVPWGDPIPAVCVTVIVQVTDDNGNQVYVELNSEKKTLVSMRKIYNGVDYDPNSIG